MWPALVLLDRDGVINADSPDAILTPDQWQPLPGSLKATARDAAFAHVPVFDNLVTAVGALTAPRAAVGEPL